MNKNSFLEGLVAQLLPKLYAIFLLCCISGVYAQPTTVTGTVSDAVGVLVGATVQVKGKPTVALTDFDGKYTIKAKTGDLLLFSYVGYKQAAVLVGDQRVIDVQLQEDATTLKEVIVNAGYYTVKDKERTGSIASIKATEIEQQPVTSVLATLQGRMSGVNITQATGVPGGGFSIQIRGVNSIRPEGNQPLYLIDGMPFSTESLGSISISGPIMGGVLNPLNGINPADIESIAVLKDADATAIYGSRGANGVVLITTKKGKKGKTQITVNSYTGAGTVSRRLNLLNTTQYISMREEAFVNDGTSSYPASAHDLNGHWDRNRYTDWQKELIGGTAITQNISVGVSGGSGNTQFMLQGTHFNETTVFPGSFSYGKNSIHFNVSHQSDNEKFTLNLSGNYVIDKNDMLGTDLTRLSSSLAPNAPALYNADGNLNWANSTWENPLRLLRGSYLNSTKGLSVGGLLSYILPASLEFKTTFGYGDSRLTESNTKPSTIFNPAFGLTSSASSVTFNQSSQSSWSVEPQLSWNKKVGRGKFNILLGSTFQERTAAQFIVYASGFSSNALLGNLAAASTTQVRSDSELMYRYMALFGRVNYSLYEKYFVNLTGRKDGSSRFGPNNRFAAFGAVGVGWLFSKETAISDALPFMSFGKLRSSYGTTGSDQIGDYQFLNTYAASGTVYNGIIGLAPSRLFNPDFSWEVNKKFELALETGYFNDRIFLTAAYFKNLTSNQLVGVPLPGTTGFDSVQANLEATVENSGFEFELRTVNFSKKDFNWTTSLNLSLSKNKLVAFPDLAGSVYANQYIIGQPLGIYKAYEFAGVNSATGIYEFTDFNGDGLLTDVEDRKKIIYTTPDYFGGLHNSLTYKKWQLDFLFQFVKQLGLNSNVLNALPGTANNVPTSVFNNWHQPGDVSSTQLFTAGYNTTAVNAYYNQFVRSDAIYSDASYIRLKNLSLSYTLPTTFIKDLHCKLYFQGQNLLTFTKFDGADPENQSRGQLPTLRVLSIGMQLKF
ncbi:SusC/RagA family TonB-linked outer membrane protein [Flavobacterium ardleyense]|uniref:SusC/RagA family TonB-linked outer membrane protein n=1 Tax=Flavobacterium ardleyense TaxID=2038737 RepID=A0ABW5Z5D6_9FLAO